MAINEMDARLISQGTQVESVGAEALIPVASGEGQPQSNITLANLADSLGKAVPQQQDAEQVVITGLYAQTSDGKMVELTRDSVAKVMSGLMGNPIASKGLHINKDLNELVNNGIYVCYDTEHSDLINMVHYPENAKYWLVVSERSATWVKQTATAISSPNTYQRFKDGSYEWTQWHRIDNFGANTKEELASMVAGVIGTSRIEEITPTDLNEIKGVTHKKVMYFVSVEVEPANIPEQLSSKTRFFIEVLNVAGYYRRQTILDTNSKNIYVRVSTGDDTWGGWGLI